MIGDARAGTMQAMKAVIAMKACKQRCLQLQCVGREMRRGNSIRKQHTHAASHTCRCVWLGQPSGWLQQQPALPVGGAGYSCVHLKKIHLRLTIEQRVVGVVGVERQQALAHVHQALQGKEWTHLVRQPSRAEQEATTCWAAERGRTGGHNLLGSRHVHSALPQPNACLPGQCRSLVRGRDPKAALQCIPSPPTTPCLSTSCMYVRVKCTQAPPCAPGRCGPGTAAWAPCSSRS